MKQASSSQRKRFNKQEQGDWLRRYRGSGLTQGEFAAQHGLKLGTLVRWLAKERRRMMARPTSFVEVPLGRERESESWVAEVSWPSGLRVRLGAAAPKSWLGSVLKGAR
jgi:hypothetical protein